MTTRIVGKEVFHNEQRSVNANTVIGQVFGNIVEPSDKEENDHWTIANDFSLRSDEPDWKSFSVRMDGYDSLTGYFNANDQVWVSVLTPGGLRSFEREKGFTPRWEASGSYSKVSYRAEKPGTYHFVVSNFDPGEHEDFFGDDSEEDLGVELRLRLRKSSSRSRKRETN